MQRCCYFFQNSVSNDSHIRVIPNSANIESQDSCAMCILKEMEVTEC